MFPYVCPLSTCPGPYALEDIALPRGIDALLSGISWFSCEKQTKTNLLTGAIYSYLCVVIVDQSKSCIQPDWSQLVNTYKEKMALSQDWLAILNHVPMAAVLTGNQRSCKQIGSKSS